MAQEVFHRHVRFGNVVGLLCVVACMQLLQVTEGMTTSPNYLTSCSSEILACSANSDCGAVFECTQIVINATVVCEPACFSRCSQITTAAGSLLWETLSSCMMQAGVVLAQGQAIRLQTSLGLLPENAFLTGAQQEALKLAVVQALELIESSVYLMSVRVTETFEVFVERILASVPSESQLAAEVGQPINSEITTHRGPSVHTFVVVQSVLMQGGSIVEGSSSSDYIGNDNTSLTVLIIVSVLGAAVAVGLFVFAYTYCRNNMRAEEKAMLQRRDSDNDECGDLDHGKYKSSAPAANSGSTTVFTKSIVNGERFMMRQTSFFKKIRYLFPCWVVDEEDEDEEEEEGKS